MALRDDQLQQYLEMQRRAKQGITDAEGMMEQNMVSPEERLQVQEAAKLRNLAAGLQSASNKFGSVQGKVVDSSDFTRSMEGMNQADSGSLEDKMKQFQMAQGNRDRFADNQFQAVNGLAGLEDKESARMQASIDKKDAAKEAQLGRENLLKMKNAELANARNLKAMEIAEKSTLGGTPEGKTAKLNSTDKQTLDKVTGGLNAVRDMRKALKNNNSFSLVGDNDYTIARERFVEHFGRLQSGGAIGKDEQARFEKLAPRWNDSKEQQAAKLKELESMFVGRLGTLGFQEQEVAGIKPAELNEEEQNQIAAADGYASELAARRTQDSNTKIGKNMTKGNAQSYLNLRGK